MFSSALALGTLCQVNIDEFRERLTACFPNAYR